MCLILLFLLLLLPLLGNRVSQYFVNFTAYLSFTFVPVIFTTLSLQCIVVKCMDTKRLGNRLCHAVTVRKPRSLARKTGSSQPGLGFHRTRFRVCVQSSLVLPSDVCNGESLYVYVAGKWSFISCLIIMS